jgi:hypothetical protein
MERLQDEEGGAPEGVRRPGHMFEDYRLHASSFLRCQRLELGAEFIPMYVTHRRTDQTNGRHSVGERKNERDLAARFGRMLACDPASRFREVKEPAFSR